MAKSSRQARGTRHPLGDSDLEPLSRRALQAAGALSLLLILVVVNSLLDSGSESPFNPNPVAAAAERTTEVPGMRIEMTMQVESEGAPPVTVTGDGVYNGKTNLAEVLYNGTTSQGQQLEFDAILGESAWYFRYFKAAAEMPEGKQWIKIEGLPGQQDMSTPGVASPDESLQMLSGSGTVRRLGQATVGHAPTTHYQVTQTPAEIVEALHSQGKDELADAFEAVSSQIVGSVRTDVFISKDRVVRRLRTVSTTIADGKPVTTKMRMDFSDFGIKPNIPIPPDSQVYDITPQLEEGLDALGQAS